MPGFEHTHLRNRLAAAASALSDNAIAPALVAAAIGQGGARLTRDGALTKKWFIATHLALSCVEGGLGAGQFCGGFLKVDLSAGLLKPGFGLSYGALGLQHSSLSLGHTCAGLSQGGLGSFDVGLVGGWVDLEEDLAFSYHTAFGEMNGIQRSPYSGADLNGLHRFEFGHVVSKDTDVLLFHGGDVDSGRRRGCPSGAGGGGSARFATACKQKAE